MKLPNARLALVEREKIIDYLLSPAHRFGSSKARFFITFGFRAEAWEALAAALHELRRASLLRILWRYHDSRA